MSKLIKKILIVDDDASTRDVVRLALQEQDSVDVEVTESADVKSGIAQVKANRPDIVILDLHMPGQNGFDFMDILRSDKSLAGTKIIIMTVDDTLANVFKAEHKGVEVFHFLAKPFNISELQAIVLELCLKHSAKNLPV